MKQRDTARLLDMLIAARKIRRFTRNMTFAEFISNEMAQSAVIRELQVIGEAARLISEETQDQYPDIDWAAIRGMRNRLIHEYFSIRLEIVWGTATRDIVALI
ncbi:MAG: DUF86 domain-containing protein, partial [Chloroflexi bacterium]